MKFPRTRGGAIWELMALIFLHNIISTLLLFIPDNCHVVAGGGGVTIKTLFWEGRVPLLCENRGPRCSALRYGLGHALPIGAGTPRSLILKW